MKQNVGDVVYAYFWHHMHPFTSVDGGGVWAVYPVVFAHGYIVHHKMPEMFGDDLLSIQFTKIFEKSDLHYDSVFCFEELLLHLKLHVGWRSLEPSTIFSEKAILMVLKEVINSLLSSSLLLSTRGLVVVYLAIASLSVQIGLTVLLWQQLCYIYKGKTYLDDLSSSDSGSDERGCQNLFRFFGCPYSASRFAVQSNQLNPLPMSSAGARLGSFICWILKSMFPGLLVIHYGLLVTFIYSVSMMASSFSPDIQIDRHLTVSLVMLCRPTARFGFLYLLVPVESQISLAVHATITGFLLHHAGGSVHRSSTSNVDEVMTTDKHGISCVRYSFRESRVTPRELLRKRISRRPCLRLIEGVTVFEID
ncbi:hypothetical protein ACLOJK_014399 [Asimina triloba]